MLAVAAIAHAQPQRCRDGLQPSGDPRNAEVICLPEVGRMLPPGTPCVKNFGQQIIPLGDIDGDSLADWIIERVRCDTSDSYPHYPEEVLLFHGVKGILPLIESSQRIGPTELLSLMRVLTVGDWDGNNHVDIAAYVQVYSENTLAGRVIVFWADEGGRYSIADTSRLSCDADGWYGWESAVSVDVTGDSIQDLVMYGWYGYGLTSLTNGKEIPVPKLLLFQGHRGQRWGREGVPHSADLRWWNPPPMNMLSAGDHDGDGYVDLYLHNNGFPSYVSVLYGRPEGGLPDTTNVESADLASIGARTSLFVDVTGDRIPELVVTNDVRHLLRVYIGLRGQRLSNQFGIEPPHPGEKQWWGKPWAEVWEPPKINPTWAGPYDRLYDLGDIDNDGVGDLCSFSGPWVTVYRGGNWLDSLIDGMIDCRAAGGGLDDDPDGIAVLGDIDGSGIPTIAVGVNGVLYVKATTELPKTADWRRVPDGTGPAAVVAPTTTAASMNLSEQRHSSNDNSHNRQPAGRK
jgi:hypothetical protein